MNIRQQEPVPDVTIESFDRQVTRSPVPVLVNFQTPCSRRMEPLLDQLAEAFAGRLRVVRVNIAANPALAARFKIRAVPTMLLFKKGVPVEFIVGTVPARFVFATIGKSCRGTRLPKARRTRQTSRWPSSWPLAFDAPSL